MQKLLLPLVLAAFVAHPAWAQIPFSDDNSASVAAHLPAHVPAPTFELSGTLTLAVALTWAMRNSPDIAIAAREVEALEGTVRQAGVIPNPSLGVAIEDTRQATRTTTVQLSVPIELGGKRAARMNAAQLGRSAAAIELTGKRAEVRSVVVAAFYDVVIAQERYRLVRASVQLAQRASNAAAKRVLAGKVSPVDETRARVAEANVRAELALVASEVQGGRRRLAATWGSTHPRFERAVDQVEALPVLPPLDDLMQQLQQAPSLARARNEVERRQALAQLERARQIPDVTLSLGAKRDEQLGRNQAIFGVSIPIALFDRNQGNVLEFLRRTDKARDELVATALRLTTELGQAHGRLDAARQEAELLRLEILPGAQSAYDATSKGFDLGKFGFLDVLDAQRTLFQAKSQYLRALADTHRAASDIDRLVGTPYTPPSGAMHQQEE